MKIDYKYTQILEDIMRYGYVYEDPNRKDVFRKELETVHIKHLVQEGFPIVTARKTFFKGAVGELLLFLKGSTDIRDYHNYGIRFWDKDFARYQGYKKEQVDELYKLWKKGISLVLDTGYDMGKIYAYQYKKQHSVFDNFKENPLRTDLIIDSWQVDDLKDMCLIPCHYSFQIVGSEDGFLIVWNQRSTDFLLGTPINIQFYFLMGMLLELWSGHKFNGVVGNLCKVHLYDNQLKLASEMIKLPTSLYKEGVVVKLELEEDLKDLPFSEFIKKIEPSNFKIEDYDFILNESVEMLTYKK